MWSSLCDYVNCELLTYFLAINSSELLYRRWICRDICTWMCRSCGDAGEMNVMFPLLRLGSWGYFFFDIYIWSSDELDIVNLRAKASNTCCILCGWWWRQATHVAFFVGDGDHIQLQIMGPEQILLCNVMKWNEIDFIHTITPGPQNYSINSLQPPPPLPSRWTQQNIGF